MTHDNAASRLLNLLQDAKKIDANTLSKHAWEKLLRVNKDPALLMSRMGKMLALPEQISSTLSNTAGTNPEMLLHISQQFYIAFSAQKSNDKWNEFVGRIDSHVINYLGLAMTLLETQAKTQKLEQSEINELRSGFSALLEQIRGADISPRLKSYVVKQLHDLIAILDDYFITGAEPILERIEATVGHTLIDEEYKNFLKNHQLGKSVLECLSAAANLVTVAVGIPQLTQFVHLLQHTS